MPICIAGMHRSGTSMVARLLNLCGIDLGAEQHLVRPTDDNPEGYWENSQFVNINENILSLFGGGWDFPPTLPQGWLDHQELSPMKTNAGTLYIEFRGKDHWGWKDPRNSLTIDFWKALFPEFKVVICIRNPREVAKSLYRRGWSSDTFAFNLWNIYNKTLLESLQPEQYIVTHYESYFVDPEAELKRVAKFAGLDVTEDRLHEAAATIRTTLRRNRASTDDLPQAIARRYEHLCTKAGDVFRHERPLATSLPDATVENRIAGPQIPVAVTQRPQAIASVDQKYQQALSYIQKQKTDEGLNALEGIIAVHPDHAPTHNALGSLYYHKQDKVRALLHYERSVVSDPKNLSALRNLADFYFVEVRRIEDAQRIYSRILEIQPDDLEVVTILANISLSLKQLHVANILYEKVLNLAPGDVEAKKALDAIRKILNTSTHGGTRVSEELYQEAVILAQTGLIEEATALLQKILEFHPEFALAHNDLGVLYARKGDSGRAQTHYEKAMQLEPANVTTAKNLADFYHVVLGRTEEAIQIYTEILRNNTDDVETALNLAQAHAASGNSFFADIVLRRFIDNNPAQVAQVQNRIDASQTVLMNAHVPTTLQGPGPSLSDDREKAAQSDLEKISAAASVEQADYYYYHADDPQRAFPLYLQALEQNNQDIDTLLSLASLSAFTGNKESAAMYLHRVHTIDQKSIWPGWYQKVSGNPGWFHGQLRALIELIKSPAEISYSSFAQFDDAFWYWMNTMGYRKYPQLRGLLPGLPDPKIQINLTGSEGDNSMLHGFNQYLLFKELVSKHTKPGAVVRNMLDFGCGYGRMLRYFIKDFPVAELHGLDIVEGFVKWCAENIRYGRFAKCSAWPPAGYRDGTFDVAYSFSVFSHLNPENGAAWLQELNRICADDGLVLTTIWSHPNRTKDYHKPHFPDYDSLIRDYDSGKFCFSTLKYPKDSVYAEALIPRSYIMKIWSRYFTILDIIEGHPFSPNQSYVVMKKVQR